MMTIKVSLDGYIHNNLKKYKAQEWNGENDVKHLKWNIGESETARFFFFFAIRPKWEISFLALCPWLIKTYHYSCHGDPVGTRLWPIQVSDH